MPVTSGARAALIAAEACRSGNTHDTASSTGGKVAPMTKMSETKASGSRVPRVTPVSACAECTKVITARPTTAKHTADSARTTTAAASPGGTGGPEHQAPRAR